ncbi:MAG: hypothetical protein IPN76_02240 [Saprospiraceae bacterium]|nr:hypothetical protein [Saprospiraceae bacterium]
MRTFILIRWTVDGGRPTVDGEFRLSSTVGRQPFEKSVLRGKAGLV